MTDFLEDSPAVVNVDGFTFNHVDDNGVTWTLDKISGWHDGPRVDVEQAQRIVRHGQFAQVGRRGGRTITMSGLLKAANRGPLAAAAQNLATILADGGFAPFEFIDDDLNTLWTSVQLLDMPDITWDTEPLTVRYQLSFLAPSSYKFGITSSASTGFAAAPAGVGLVFPMFDGGASTPVSDSFTRANSTTTLGTPTIGSAWSVYAGTWGINTNQAYCPTDVAGYAAAVVDSGVSDGTIEVTFATRATGSNNSALWFRSSDINNGFYAAEGNLFRRVAGVDTNLGAYSTPFVNGDRMRVLVVGASIKVYRQAGAAGAYSEVLSVTDASLASNTKHGLAVFGTTGDSARFDDFLVTAPGTTGGTLDFGAAAVVGQAAVSNNGTAPSSVRFTISGPTPTEGFVITDTTSGARIQYLGQVPTGSELVIDSAAGSVVIDGTADRLGDTIVDSPWPTIPAGGTRAFLFEPNGAATASTLTVSTVATYW